MDRREFLGLFFGLTTAAAIGFAGCGKKTDAAGPHFSTKTVDEFFSAVEDGDVDIVRRLLQAKPGLANAKNQGGQSALQVATAKGNQDMADLLRKSCAKE